MPIFVENIHAMERAWMRYQALARDPLDEKIRSTYDYAIRLASTKTINLGNGKKADVDAYITGLRNELHAIMHSLSLRGWSVSDQNAQNGTGTIAWTGNWHQKALQEAYPDVLKRLKSALDSITEIFPEAEPSLERCLQQKKLVLSLGGGGGTGYVHLCLFQWLEEAGIQPSLITGTSIGALLGCVRAMQTHYDAARTILELPSWRSIMKCLQPGLGAGKHGLHGIFRVDLEEMIMGFARKSGWSTMPAFRELRIPFSCVSSGILLRSDVQKSLESQKTGILQSFIQLTTKPLRRALEHTASIAGILSSSGAVIPVTFGLDELTRSMPVSDALAFSIQVPSVLGYELPHNHYRSREILETIFKRDGLYRLCDGGVASNVPVRTAFDAVQSGLLGHENVYILGLDVFAPQSGDPLFYPLQMIANKNAVVDATYSDAFVRLKDLMSPLELAPSLLRHKWLNGKFRKAFADEMKVIEYAMRPLLPLDAVK